MAVRHGEVAPATRHGFARHEAPRQRHIGAKVGVMDLHPCVTVARLFLFFIRDASGALLFVGQVTDPTVGGVFLLGGFANQGPAGLPYGVIVNVLLAMNVSLPMSTTVST